MIAQTQIRTSLNGWITMWIFWISYALCQVLVSGIGIMLPAMTAEMRLSPAQAGALGAIGWIMTALLSIPLNAWVTRFPPKRTLAVVLSGLVLIHLVNGWAPSYPILLIARGLGVLMVMSLLPAVVLLQKQWFSADQIGTVKGIETGMVNIGQMAALWGVPILMAEFGGWRSAYQLAAIAIVPVLVAWLLFAKENRMPNHESRLAVPHESGSPIVAALKRKEFLLLGIGAAGASIPYVAVMTFWPMYATQVKGLPLETVGPILSVVAVGSMIASFIAGVLSDKIGLRRPQPLIAGLLLPLVYFALLQFNSVPLLTAVAFLIGFGACIYVPVILTVPFELKEIQPQEIAIGIGFMIALTNAGAALGSQLAGILIEGLGLYAALAVLCVSPLMLSLCVLLCAETGPRMRAGQVNARGRQ